MKGNGNWILIILVLLLAGFGIYITWGKKGKDSSSEQFHTEDSLKNSVGGSSQSDDIEIIEPSDEPAFEIGFGMGPGLYGSGRHTSEMIGN